MNYKTLISQPIIGFILLGSALFITDHYVNQKQQTIHFTNADVQRLRAQWQSQFNTEFNHSVLLPLLYQEATEKRLFLEAKALGLEQDDVIIKRRMVQKLKFISEDISDLIIPTDTQLNSYFVKNSKNYSTPYQYSFQQIYFNPENLNFSIEAVQNTLDQLQSEKYADINHGWGHFGDPFVMGSSFINQSKNQLKVKFGENFTSQLVKIHQKIWSGPIKSAFGLHLIKISNIQQPTTASLQSIKQTVIADWQKHNAQMDYQQYLHELALKYPVSIDIDDFSDTEFPPQKNFILKEK